MYGIHSRNDTSSVFSPSFFPNESDTMLLHHWLTSIKHWNRAWKQKSTISRKSRSSHRNVSLSSQPLEIRMLLSAVNHPPVGSTVNINVQEDASPQLIHLVGDDGDPQFVQQLTYGIASNPSHGTLTNFNSAAGTVLYTPAPNYHGPDSFTYTVTDDDAVVLSLQGTVNGTLSTPGDYDTFTFSLASDSSLYFDAQTGDPNLFYSLTGPAQTITRYFDSADYYLDTPILNLPAGDYSLRIDRSGDSTGPYQFRLLNTNTASNLSFGSQVNGSLSPVNETDIYKFHAVAGNRFQFNSVSSGADIPNAYWRLIDPYGKVVDGNNLNGGDFGPVTVTNSGTFLLVVEGNQYDTGTDGNYSFIATQLTDAVLVPDVGPLLTIGQVTNGSLNTPGQIDTYTFHLDSKSKLYFDAQTASPNLEFTLKGPAGSISQLFDAADYGSYFPVMNLPAGDYSLKISRTEGTTGSYQFRLMNLDTATSITPGTVVNGTLIPTNESDFYKFNGTAGQEFYIDAGAISGDIPAAYWRLIDPYGNPIASNHLNGGDVDEVILTNTGVFTLVIEGANYESGVTGDYTINVVPVVSTAVDLTMGAVTTGNLTTPGDQDTYTFHLDTDASLYFDSQTADPYLFFTLTGPAGTITQYFDVVDYWSTSPVLKLPAGDYSLRIHRSGDSTGPYQFRLSDTNAAPNLSFGSQINGSLNPVNETDIYKFNAVAGNRFQFDFISSGVDIPSAYWRVIDPYGNLVDGRYLYGGDFGVTLTNSGTFLLVVEGYQYDTGINGGYSFIATQLTSAVLVPDTGIPLTLGEVTGSSLDTPGQIDTYLFHLDTSSQLYFDAQSADPNLQFSLTGPSGTISYLFDTADYWNTSPVMNLPAGDYSLKIDRTGGTTGPYQFNLVDLTSAVPIVPGTPVNGTLSPTNESHFYKFDGLAGEVYFIDAGEITGDIPNANWRLIDPYGSVLATSDLNGGDIEDLKLTNSGVFTLVIEGTNYESGSTGDYSINVVPVLVDTPTPAISSPANVNVTVIPVNDAPVLDDSGAPTLDALLQNQSLASNNGTLVSTLISRMGPSGGITDIDAGALPGIAINGVSNTYGSWQFTVNGGTNWTPITVTGNANALLLAADGNTRIRFLPNANFIGNTRLAFVAWDRTTGANGGTASVNVRGGTTPYSLVYEYASINVVNVAPELDTDGTPTLDPVLTNAYNVNNPGTLVSDIIARMAPNGGISDANPGASQGIAINGLLNTDKGSWQFTTNGGTSWISIGTTGNSNARLLAADANTRVRFVPIAGFAGTASFAFVAWDRTTGANGGIASVGTRGGSTAYSTAFDYASVSVVNAAPVLNDLGAPLFDGILPDIPDASNPGTLVSTIMSRMSPGGSVTDANPSALRGIAIIGKTATATGTWEYSTNNGASWSAINATGGANALLLASDANTRVRYRPNAGFRGEAKIAFTAWDQTTGTNGGTVNASTRGGTTAFSLAYEYASIFVNTAPTLDASGTPTLDAIPNTISNAANVGTPVNTILNRMGPGGITDPDPGALRGMAIIGLTGTVNGTWQYTIDNGTNWSNILTTGSANALLLSNTSTTKIRFVPNPGFVGTASIAFTAWDRTQWTNGATVNAGLRGGATPFSSLFDYAAISVTV